MSSLVLACVYIYYYLLLSKLTDLITIFNPPSSTPLEKCTSSLARSSDIILFVSVFIFLLLPLLGLRLVGGSGSWEGRVEVFYNNIWGTVCDDSWDIYDGRVVCRQLGFPGAVSAPRSARFGAGSGRIWLDNVACSGNESSIIYCGHNGWGSHNCSHGEDASVICSRGTSYETICN